MRSAATLVLLVALALGCAGAQAPSKAPVFDSSRAYEDLRQIVSFGPRPPGSAALAQTRKYMAGRRAAAGAKVSEQAFDASTPIGTVRMVNVIATLPGERPDRLVISGHYETKLFRDFRFVGANDGGSSTAFLLELARALQGRKHPLTIELVFFDGEEAFDPVRWEGNDHTYGSRHYVEAARRAGTLKQIRAMILVDMIGDRGLNIRREQGSTPWLVDLIWASARRLKYQQYFLEDSTPIEDDHVPFLDAGVPAVDIIDLDYEPWHTPDDTLDKVSARSLQIVGDVLLDALPRIEQRLLARVP